MAANEYDSYIGDIFELLASEAKSKKIYDYLQWVGTERMGLTDANGEPLIPQKHREKAVNALMQLTASFNPQ